MLFEKAALLSASVLLVLVATGCNGFGKQMDDPWADVTEPNWVEHVSPMMELYCNECHGETGTQGAPSSFRLDIYETIDEPGSYEKRDRSLARILDTTAPMPPLSFSHQPTPSVAPVFQIWVDNGAPYEAIVTTETGGTDTGSDDTGASDAAIDTGGDSGTNATTDTGATGATTGGQ